jgi:hypothetical protein
MKIHTYMSLERPDTAQYKNQITIRVVNLLTNCEGVFSLYMYM